MWFCIASGSERARVALLLCSHPGQQCRPVSLLSARARGHCLTCALVAQACVSALRGDAVGARMLLTP